MASPLDIKMNPAGFRIAWLCQKVSQGSSNPSDASLLSQGRQTFRSLATYLITMLSEQIREETGLGLEAQTHMYMFRLPYTVIVVDSRSQPYASGALSRSEISAECTAIGKQLETLRGVAGCEAYSLQFYKHEIADTPPNLSTKLFAELSFWVRFQDGSVLSLEAKIFPSLGEDGNSLASLMSRTTISGPSRQQSAQDPEEADRITIDPSILTRQATGMDTGSADVDMTG